MQNLIISAAVVAAFIFGFFVVRAWERFWKENHISHESRTDTERSLEDVEK